MEAAGIPLRNASALRDVSRKSYAFLTVSLLGMPSKKSRSPSNSVWTLSGVVTDAGTFALYCGSCAETAADADNSSKALAAILNWVLLMFMDLLSPWFSFCALWLQ